MRLAIFGAETGMGRALTETALEAGHVVRTHASDLREYPLRSLDHDRLTVTEGDAFDVRAVEDMIRDADAVCSAIGLNTDRPPGVTPSDGTANILGAMNQFLVSRIVSATAVGVGESADYVSFGRRLRSSLFDRERFADLARQERLLRESDHEWVIVRPPRLTDGPRNLRSPSGDDRRLSPSCDGVPSATRGDRPSRKPTLAKPTRRPGALGRLRRPPRRQ
ncbi:NmrA family protein [Halobacteriales archaeon QH_6_64_20]|nr:MAG: NmrA family protein [Halobacteriales archaeon QH_6_64_20]